MTIITKKEVEKVAKLARIALSDSDKEKLTKQLDSIIDWVKILEEVDTKNVESITNVHEISMPMVEDEVLEGDLTKEVLANTQNSKYNYYTVPKVIE